MEEILTPTPEETPVAPEVPTETGVDEGKEKKEE